MLLRRGGCCVCFVVDERIERGVECLRDDRQQRHGHASSSLLERVHRLLGNPQHFRELHLGDGLRLAAQRDALAEGDEGL